MQRWGLAAARHLGKISRTATLTSPGHLAICELQPACLPMLTQQKSAQLTAAAVKFHMIHTSVTIPQQAQTQNGDEEHAGDHPRVAQHSEKPKQRYSEGRVAPHKGLQKDLEPSGEVSYMMHHPVYEKEYLESVHPRHKEPKIMLQKTGFYAVQVTRTIFDWVTGYGHKMNEAKWLQRIIFLETVAGVPGMVGGMLRHMRSLRTMRRDHGWIHTLLEEAENERMHLLTFMELRQPGPVFRAFVLLAQGVFFNAYFLTYVLSPKHCHAFVGYLEEEAVKTYTRCIKELDEGKLPEWSNKFAPEIAKTYWQLSEGATMRDLLLAVRADEACHSHVNHRFSEMRPTESNPFGSDMHTVA